MKKRVTALVLSLVMVVSGVFAFDFTSKADTCGGLEEEDVYEPREGDVIKDPILHWAIRSALNTIKDAPILTEEVVGSKNVADISYELCAHPEDFEHWTKQYWIENLEGLQYAKSARMIDICYTNATEGKKIEDLSPISGLTQLKMLLLKQDGITDISALSALTNLEQLDLSENKDISNVDAISDMKKLKRLGLGYNKITDVSAISELSALEYVNLTSNQITSLPDMSKLQSVYHLDVSGNQLTNEDVVKIAQIKNLRELTLTSNPQITDLKPLARLIYLEEDKTFLPITAEEKGNLFAAIEVNKLFNTFNISKMSESDLENVGKALDAYEALNDVQKAYIDAKRVEAAKNNKKLVEAGSEPKYYEEYDEGGENQPVLDRLEIKVVDKYGKPMSGIGFIKTTSVATNKYTTDDNGNLTVRHVSWDAGEMSIAPESDSYVAVPEKITYEVKSGKTYIINGKLATGLEKLQFVLVPKDEYVDKSELEEAIKAAQAVEEEYKYTASSYKMYSDALSVAQEALNDADAKKEAVETATANLLDAIKGLEKTNVLTELKLKVVDENGNIFTRPFKFQIYVPNTHAEGWNQLSNEYTGLAYLQASPTWADGKEWEIAACYEEPYEIEPIQVTIGVTANGDRYYKTVNGKAIDVDFEQTVVAKALPGGATDKDNERKPSSTVLEKYLEEAQKYAEADYTESSFAKLQTAVTQAESALEKSDAAQEDYNQAAADLLKAEDELIVAADKLALNKEIGLYSAYTQSMYTAESWKVYEEKLSQAREVYDNGNATQEEVDNALSELRKAEASLKLKADKTDLGKKLEEAKALNEEDYVSGYEQLQSAIVEAQKVYDNEEATQAQADEAIKQLQDAIDALEKKPAEVDYECYSGVFRALIQDESGQALSGVRFEAQIEGVADTEKLISGQDGVLVYNINGNYRGKKTTVKLADERYTTTDEHWFIAEGINQWIAYMTTVDGEDYRDGIKLTYTLKGSGSEKPDPEKPDPEKPDPEKPDPEKPDPGTIDKRELKDIIDIVESMTNKKADYTEESWQKMQDVLVEAKKVYEDSEAQQAVIDEWETKLREAKAGLVEVEKPIVCDKSSIRILVKDEEGNKVTDNLTFTIALGSYAQNLPLKNGVLEYTLSDAEQGVDIITVAPKKENIEINGEEYIISPEKHEFTITYSTLGVFIEAIDGKELDGTQEVVFTLSKKTPDTPEVTEWSEICFTYEGSAVTGLSKAGEEYIRKNPDIIIPEKSDDGTVITEIAAKAFENCGVKSVTLPASLTTIGERAFAGNELTSVKIPDKITSIAKDAFAENAGTVTLEVSNEDVFSKLNNAGLEGVSVKDTSGSFTQPTKPDTPAPVQKVKVTKITLTGISKKIAAGKKVTLAANVSPANADNKAVTWTSSNKKVATVDSKGVVTVKKKTGGKKVKITATAKDGSGVKATYTITSMKGVVKKVAVSGSKSVKAGKSLKLKAKVTASKGANKKVAWTSSNTKYAKVSSSGKVTTYKAGKGKKVKITAKATDGSGKKKTVTVKIK